MKADPIDTTGTEPTRYTRTGTHPLYRGVCTVPVQRSCTPYRFKKKAYQFNSSHSVGLRATGTNRDGSCTAIEVVREPVRTGTRLLDRRAGIPVHRPRPWQENSAREGSFGRASDPEAEGRRLGGHRRTLAAEALHGWAQSSETADCSSFRSRSCSGTRSGEQRKGAIIPGGLPVSGG